MYRNSVLLLILAWMAEMLFGTQGFV